MSFIVCFVPLLLSCCCCPVTFVLLLLLLLLLSISMFDYASSDCMFNCLSSGSLWLLSASSGGNSFSLWLMYVSSCCSFSHSLYLFRPVIYTAQEKCSHDSATI